MKIRRNVIILIALAILLIPKPNHAQAKFPLSEATEACLECHATLHPGIVSEWKTPHAM